MRAHLVAALLSPLLLACTEGGKGPSEASSGAKPDPAEAAPGPTLEERSRAALLAAAGDYWVWGRVDERPRLAPAPCADPSSVAPGGGFPSHVRLSEADEGEHQRKLYYLFAGELSADGHGQTARNLYVSLGSEPKPLPVGFTIVKQSWTATTDPHGDAREPKRTLRTPEPVTFVVQADETLHIGEPAALFVMSKIGPPDLEGTDAGWIYGTLSPDGETVTSVGKVQPCMDCHEAAPHERLFGLQTTKALVDVPTALGDEPMVTKDFGIE